MPDTSHIPNWWQPLQVQAKAWDADGAFLVRDEALMAQMIHPATHGALSGIAGVGDPYLVKALQVALDISNKRDVDDEDVSGSLHMDPASTPLGAFELDGATVVAFEDPTDGLRSYCTLWLVVPGAHLRTRLPDVPVFVQRTDSSEWEGGDKNKEETPIMIDLVSRHTNEVLLSMGTQYDDEYYPCAKFGHYPEAMDNAVRERNHDIIDEGTPSGLGRGVRVRL